MSMPPPGPPPAGPPPWPKAHEWPPPGPPNYPPPYPAYAGPQPPWGPAGPPPQGPRRGRAALMGASALVAVIALAVAATLWWTHRDSGGSGPPSASGTADVASASDTGPVGIITSEPTCRVWQGLQDRMDARLNDWYNRDRSLDPSAWTPAQRAMIESAGQIWREHADKIAPLVELTPHRVVRELYEQQIAYARAYADAIPRYDDDTNALGEVAYNIGETVSDICIAINSAVAAGRAPGLPAAPDPSSPSTPADPANPALFLKTPSPVCPDVEAAIDRTDKALTQWYDSDANLPAAQRDPADAALWAAAATTIADAAADNEKAADAADNPVMADFLVLSAQYLRAFSGAVPSYVPDDATLYDVGNDAATVVYWACPSGG